MRHRAVVPGGPGAWVVACAAAELVGMTVAAGAARAGQAIVEGGTSTVVALALVVVAGVVEGTALGAAQVTVLGSHVTGLRRQRYVVLTVLVAGLGWAAASAPGVLAPADAGTSPAPWLVVAGGAGLGVVMGALLGTAQATALPPAGRRTWRWANVAAWPPAMVVILVGAGVPGVDWSLLPVLATGAVTGAAAGAVLGLVSGAFLPTLTRRVRPTRESGVLQVR